jgi:hypothetical protein
MASHGDAADVFGETSSFILIRITLTAQKLDFSPNLLQSGSANVACDGNLMPTADTSLHALPAPPALLPVDYLFS